MDKDRFLDVNGFSVEYDIPLEKRLNKYRKSRRRDASRISVSLTEKLAEQSDAWQMQQRHKQALTALVAAAVFAIVVALAVYLVYFV